MSRGKDWPANQDFSGLNLISAVNRQQNPIVPVAFMLRHSIDARDGVSTRGC